MAGSSGAVSSVFERNSGATKLIKVHFVADDTDGSIVPAVTITNVNGYRLRSVAYVPGATVFDAASDWVVTDSIPGVNLVATNGANKGGASATYTASDTADQIIIGDLTVDITGNTTVSAICDLYLVLWC